MFSLIGQYFLELVVLTVCVFSVILLYVSIADNLAARQAREAKGGGGSGSPQLSQGLASMRETAKDAGARDLQDAWPWFIALGGSLVLFGVLASVGLAFQTVASANLVGILMACGGVALIAHGLNMRRMGWFYFWLATGLLYAMAGLAVLYDPAFAITTVTLFLAADFIVIGFLRLWIAMGARDSADGWWLMITCVVTIGLSALFTLRPAISALWVLICALAFDLLMQGAAFAAMGVSRNRQVRARRHAHADSHR